MCDENAHCAVSLAQCNVHAMQSSCFQRGQSQLALPCRTKLASMSTCTSPSERTQYCSEQYGKLLVYNVRCFGPSRKYFHMTFAGSAVPPTRSCPRDITPHSRYIYSTHLCLNIVFAPNRELTLGLLTCIALADEIIPETVHPVQRLCLALSF